MSKKILRYDIICRLCGSEKIKTVLKLRDTPLEDQFIREDQLKAEQPVYPLELAICENCGYLHLPYIVNPEESYSEYIYVSGVTVGLRGHYDEYAKSIQNDFQIKENSLIVDLGSNDGSMLASFKKIGMKIQGVEPAPGIAKQANESGLDTINGFFSRDTVTQIIERHGKANVVTANYMYANIDNVIEFTQNVCNLLSEDGIFVVQTGYHPEQFKINMFDYIYHEHFSYFSVEVLQSLFDRCGLELIQAKKLSPKGGSIRVIAQLKGGARKIDPQINELIKEEINSDIRNPDTFRKFNNDLDKEKKSLIDILSKYKKEGKKIIGFGASHSTTTLLYHFELFGFLDYIVDDNVLKQNKYSPGFHIPVYSSDKLYSEIPDYVVVLAWQHKDSILKKHLKYSESGGHWIIPLPNLITI